MYERSLCAVLFFFLTLGLGVLLDRIILLIWR